MGFWFFFFLFVGFQVVGELLRPRNQQGRPEPSSLGEFTLPTAAEGRPIPVVFGTVKVAGANVVWAGDFFAKALTKKVKTGYFSSTEQHQGYSYFMGLQLALCHGPIDEFVDVRFDNRPIPAGKVTIDASNDGLVAGLIPSAPTVSSIAHGDYTDLQDLAEAAQVALRNQLADCRVVFGFEVRAGISDSLFYKARIASTGDPKTEATVAPGLYTGTTYAAAVAAAMNAAEALIVGGARLQFSAEFTGSQIQITAKQVRAPYDGWEILTSGGGADIDYDTSTLPVLGARFADDWVSDVLPSTWDEGQPVGPDRFMFSYPNIHGKLVASDSRCTAAEVLGVDRTPAGARVQYARPNWTWGGSPGVIGYAGVNAHNKALSDLSNGSFVVQGTSVDISSGNMCSTVGVGCQLSPIDDPGDGGDFVISFTGKRGGAETLGNVKATFTLYAGQPPVEEGGDGTTGLAVAAFTATLSAAGFQTFSYTLTPAEVTAFRANGGFSVGARIIIDMFEDGGGSCLTKQARLGEASLRVPATGYHILKHHRAYQPREIGGIVASETTDQFLATVHLPQMFGDPRKGGEGGVSGQADIYKGTLTQTANAYLEAKQGETLPGYRGICYAVLRKGNRGFYVGGSPYLKPIAFVIRRFPNDLGLTGNMHKLNSNADANPACMLYEILTNDRWGLARTAAEIDVDSFKQAGEVLFSEGFGLSMQFDRAQTGDDMLAEILRHIDGTLFTDMRTGLLTLTLARKNYQSADLLELNENHITSVRLSRPAWEGTVNAVRVNYVDRTNDYQQRVAQAQDLANVQIRGGQIVEESFSFLGVGTPELAQLIAARELRTVSYPLAPIEITVNRRAFKLNPGGVFALTWGPLGFERMACRITAIGGGNLLDGTIRITAVEDIFGVEATGYTAPAASGWVDPIGLPSGLAASRLFEVPYALVVGPERLALALGAQAAQAQQGYEVWADTTGENKYAEAARTTELTPSALLSKDHTYTETVLKVTTGVGLEELENGSDADFIGGRQVLLVGEELIAWRFIEENADGSFTLSGCVRGVADTTPGRYVVGERVWFITAGASLTSTAPYAGDATIAAKLLAFTTLGRQELHEVEAVTLTTRSRASRPYLPTDIRINGEQYPAQLPQPAQNVSISWKHRNRLADWSWDNAGETDAPEDGTTYTVRFYGESDTLLKTISAIDDLIAIWDTEVADAGSRQQRIRIELEAVVGGVESFTVFNYTVHRAVVDTDTPTNVRRRRPRRRRGAI